MVVIDASKSLKKAEGLRDKLQDIGDLLSCDETWTLQQQLVNSYRSVLMLDLEYALDKKVEQDLWIYAFKAFIGKLQLITKDKKHPKRSEGQAMLHWCLESAAAFYLCLLNEVATAFDLDLPFKRHGSFFGCKPSPVKDFPQDVKVNKNSCYYICQHCLVHLGDIARYKNQNRQAEIFYSHGVALSPTSGQPYNQLAILEASRGDKVSAVFHYMRAVALSHPFYAAATNLNRVLEIHSEDAVNMDGYSKLSSHEYLAAFLKLHGLLNSHAELEKADKLVQILTTSLTAHIATESLSGWKLVQILAINIYAFQKIEGEDGRRIAEKEMTATELRVKSLVSNFLAGCLNAFLLPVYTINTEEPLLQYFAMPAVKLTVEWIRLHPEILTSTAFNTRRQIWPSLCCLLNKLQPYATDVSLKKCDHVPLPEERDLQGFLPFENTFKHYSFHTDDMKTDVCFLNKLRAARIVQFGKWLTEQTPQLISKSDGNVFETVGKPEPPGELLEELEELSLGKPELSTDSSVPLDSTQSSVPANATQQCLEKKGILKSELPADKLNDIKGAKGKRNVALTSLMLQKAAEETKQVTFRTPSPVKEKVSNKNAGNKASLEKTKPKKFKPDDFRLLQQHKLLEVLEHPPEKKNDDTSLPENDIKVTDISSTKISEDTKQQLLSALFDSSNLKQQPQNMSGLLNLNKQQQQLLINSKSTPKQQPQTTNRPVVAPRPQNVNRNSGMPGHKRVVEKMEAARKEYEDAMFVLQQRKIEQPEMLRYPAEPEPYRYDQMMMVSNAPPPPPQHVFVPLNQPMMGMQPMPTMQPLPQLPPMQNMQPFPYKMHPNMMAPWQEQEPQPPMPPPWWTSMPPPPHVPSRDVQNFRQPPLSTYSLFSNPMVGDTDSSLQMPGRLVNQQSFWSGPGPSPLERLLEQQRKQMRDTEPNT